MPVDLHMETATMPMIDVYATVGTFAGPHGMGLALDAPNEARGWTTQLLAWLAQRWGA